MAKTLAQELSDVAESTAESWVQMSQDGSYSRDLREAFARAALLMEEVSDLFHNAAREISPILLDQENDDEKVAF